MNKERITVSKKIKIEASRLVCANMFMCPCRVMGSWPMHLDRGFRLIYHASSLTLSCGPVWTTARWTHLPCSRIDVCCDITWLLGPGLIIFVLQKSIVSHDVSRRMNEPWRAWYTSHLFVLLRVNFWTDRILQEKFVRLSTYDQLSRGKVKLITQATLCWTYTISCMFSTVFLFLLNLVFLQN
jgi:hypothetical protein